MLSETVGVEMRRALVIDDDISIRILVGRILQRREFEVDTAKDGAEGIEKITATPYDLIVLDLMMPRIDGTGVVRYLTEHNPEVLSHIIVMTAFGASAFAKVSPPVARCIEKPFDVDELVAEVNATLAANEKSEEVGG